MDQVVQIDSLRVMLALVAGVGLIFSWIAFLGVRSPLLVTIGARNIPRRRTRAALIVAGLMLSTTVIGSAFGIGDAMTHTVRSVVTDSLGTVDEVVVVTPPRERRREQLRALTEPGLGSLAAARLPFFSQAEVDRVRMAAVGSDAIAGVMPAIAEQRTVLADDSQQLQTATLVLAIPTDLPQAFGVLESVNGVAIGFTSLGADDVVINESAADDLGVTAGQSLQFMANNQAWASLDAGIPWTVTIAAITRDTGITGTQPVILVPLPRYQEMRGRGGEINQILVANQGGLASVERTDMALEQLRAALVNREIAQDVHDILNQPDMQQGLTDAHHLLEEGDRDQLTSLSEEASRDEVSDRFISLISDPAVRAGLNALAAQHLPREQQFRTTQLLRDVSDLAVLPVKQHGVEQANDYGAVVTTVFLVLGIFSVGASILLILLTFSLLAADRAAELATMRALGMRQPQVMGVFLVEGLIYNVVSALLGMLAGIAAALVTTVSIARALEPFGFDLRPHVELRSVVQSLLIGILLTFSVMLFSAWRAARTQIVGATRGETSEESQSWRIWAGGALALAGLLIWQRWHDPALVYAPRPSFVLPVVMTLLALGAGIALSGVAQLSRRTGGFTGILCGASITVVWANALSGIPAPRAGMLSESITVAVGGLAMLFAVVWTVTYGLAPALRLLDGALAPVARLRAIVRPVAGQFAWRRTRFVLTVVMFGMVIFIMAASLALSDALLNAYAGSEAPVAGFELRGDLRGGVRIDDMQAALVAAVAVSPKTFDAVGSSRTQDVQAIQLGAERSSWRSVDLALLDRGFLDAVRIRMQRRAYGYESDASVWATVRENPGTAVLSSALARTLVTVDFSTERGPINPIDVWVRPNDALGRPIPLTIVGIIDARSELAPALYTSVETSTPLGVTLPPADTWFFSVPSGVRTSDAAEGLRVSFADESMVVADLGNTLRVIQSVRALLIRLVQGFMGLGLIAGIAALGLLGVQSVIERRQQLGTLRALGFTRWQIRSSLALESALVALAGVTVGIALGLFLARTLVALLASRYPEVVFTIPWEQIGLTATVAWLGSLLSIGVAAWQAGRVAPAEALRG